MTISALRARVAASSTSPSGAATASIGSMISGFLTLAASGSFATLGFTLIASNRWKVLPPALNIFVILYSEWQMLALTIAKLGIDQLVFAAVSEDPSIRFDLRPFTLRCVLPLSAAAAIAAFFSFSPSAAIALFVTTCLDVVSTAHISELNARGRYKHSAGATLLKYPLFFLLLLAYSRTGLPTEKGLLLLFVFTSIARIAWTSVWCSAAGTRADVRPNASVLLGAQQGLNYFLFKADQLCLPAISRFGHPSSTYIAQFVFMAKFPDLLSNVTSIAGAVMFPRFFLAGPLRQGTRSQLGKTTAVVIMLLLGGLVASGLIYRSLWRGEAISPTLAAPFIIKAMMVFPANLMTYSLLRQGCLKGLMIRLAAITCCGLAVLFISGCLSAFGVIPWVTALQLLVFGAAVMLFSWGSRSALYAPVR